MSDEFDRAIELVKSGKKQAALPIFAHILMQNPKSEETWMWLATCIGDEQKEMDCYLQVIKINPDNQQARTMLKRLERRGVQPTAPHQKTGVKGFTPREISTGDQNQNRESGASLPATVEPAGIAENHPGTGVDQGQFSTDLLLPKENQAEFSNLATEPDENTPKTTLPKSVRRGPADEEGEKLKITGSQKKSKAGNRHKKQEKKNTHQPEVHGNDIKRGSVEREVVSDDAMQDRNYVPPVDASRINIETRYKEATRAILPEDYFQGMRRGVKYYSRMTTGVYGNRIIVDGRRISINDAPDCLRYWAEPDNLVCENCVYFSPINCILRYDSFLLKEIRGLYITQLRKQLHQLRQQQISHEIKKLKFSAINAIHTELKSHGRPLHYTIIARITIDRYPDFNLTEARILNYLLLHPELFEKVDSGVFRAI